MALPVNIDLVTVSGTFVNSDDGSPCVGTIEFVPVPCWWLAADAATTIIGTPVSAELDPLGYFEVDLIATDDDDLNPVDWTYRCRVKLTDCGTNYSFDMAVPMGGDINLSDVTPVFSSEGNAILVGPRGPQGDDGPIGPPGPPGGPWLAMTQEEYDSLPDKDPTVLYVILP